MNEDGLGVRPSIFDASSSNPCKCYQRRSTRRRDCYQSKSEALTPPSDEIGALDYLLKPFGRERALAALEGARQAMEHAIPAVAARASRVLSAARPLTRVFVKEKGRMIAIPLERVERLEACDDYVALCVEGRRHLLHARLQDLYARIDQTRFLRVHRSHVVNRTFITAIEPRDGARLTLVLASGERIPASRAGSALVRSVEMSG